MSLQYALDDSVNFYQMPMSRMEAVAQLRVNHKLRANQCIYYYPNGDICEFSVARDYELCDLHYMKEAGRKKMAASNSTSKTFSLDDYVEVKDRIGPFWEKYPEGRIETDVVELGDDRVTVKALIFRDQTSENPMAIGHSYMKIPGTTPYTKGSELENAETSAVGRALAFIGIGIEKSIASAHEVYAKTQDNSAKEPAATDKQKAAIRKLAEDIWGASWQTGLVSKYGVSDSKSLTFAAADSLLVELEAEVNN